MKLKKKEKCGIREFSSFVGLLVISFPAVRYGLLYTKSFEREKFIWIENSHRNYDEDMSLSEILLEDFTWWENNIIHAYQPIKQYNYCLEIFSDASTTGWGVFCNSQKTHGWWSEMESSFHINYLELVAAFYGLKCFANNYKDCEILLRIDNTTAVKYINRMGGVQYPHLYRITKTRL